MLTTAEKQLLSTLAWFRSRYALFLGFALDRKADRAGIEQFGAIWIGAFKEDWSAAFESLLHQNILQQEGDAYSFTAEGDFLQAQVETETPFYKYEYDSYFNQEKTSAAHARFCEAVYGMNLSQHGLIDQAELSVLMQLLQQAHPQSIADIGCGNGKITEWIANELKTNCLGIDISSEAIQHARARTQQNPLLCFEQGNLNQLPLAETFDAVLFLDTLYYANNLHDTLQNSLSMLRPGGHIYAYFSQWIMDEAYRANLQPDQTHLAKVLNALNCPYKTHPLTESGIHHWKKKRDVLLDMKDEFTREGNAALWDYRYREADRYANWGDQKYARYLYVIRP